MRSRCLCFNCLAPGHNSTDCRSPARCHACGGKHHTLIHRENSNAPVTVNVAAATNVPAPIATTQLIVNVASVTTNAVTNDIPKSLPNTLMITSNVSVQGPNGKSIVTRALLDSGASMSMLSNKVAHTLQLPRQATNISFSGAQDTPLQGSQHLTQVSLCTLSSSEPIASLTAAIVVKITCNLPLQGAAHVRDMPHISPLALADPTFHMPGQIDLLLGCDVLPDIMLHEHGTGPKDAPMAVKTVFGSAILGKFLPVSIKQTVNIVTQPDSVHSDELLARFWQVEEPPATNPYSH